LNELLDFLECADDNIIPETGINVALFPPTNAVDDITDDDSGGEEDPVVEKKNTKRIL